MTATTGVRENAVILAKTIRKAGIKVKPYQRNPLYGTPNTTFSLAIDRDVLWVWAGTAKVTVIPANKGRVSELGLKQAVLQVFEAARKVENTVALDYQEWLQWTDLEAAQKRIDRRDIRSKLGVTMPVGTRYSVVALDRKEVKPEDLGYYWTDYGTITVRGSTRATHQNFLVGKDERSQFVSALPRKATSVIDAHNALRPEGVPSTALRQGEWFFVPATAAEKKAITAAVERRGLHPDTVGSSYSWSGKGSCVGPLERDSSHCAPAQINVNNRLYAVGVVYDTRQGHHGSLILPDWHKVVRNREQVNVAAAGGGGGRWD